MNPRIVPDRDSKYMGQALILSAFSKDPHTQVGAVIIDKHNVPLGTGYNCPASDIDDSSFSWARPEPGSEELSKYDLVVHAEKNAIRNSRKLNLSGCTIYVSAFPCKLCANEIVISKISRVVYLDFKSDAGSILNLVQRKRSTEILEKSRRKIKVEKFEGDLTWLGKHLEHLKIKGIL